MKPEAKLFLFLLMLCMIYVCTGCASITVNPETGEVRYSRFGDQHIKGLIVMKETNKITVKLEGQDSEATALTSAINVLGGLAGAAK